MPPTPAWWDQVITTAPKGMRVGIYASGGAPYHHAALLALWGCEPVPTRAEDIRAGQLADLSALIVPGGGFAAMDGLMTPLGPEGADAVRAWVGEGGMYLSSCAGSFLPAELGEGYWRTHETARRLHMVRAPLANGSNSVFEGLTSPGVGTIRVRTTDPGHWLLEGLPEQFELVHYNGPLFDLSTPLPPGGDAKLSTPQGVLAPCGATDAFTPSEGFTQTAPKETVFGRCTAQGAFTGVTARYGEGHVVLFGSHPEFGFDALQLGWGRGVSLIANALRYQAAQHAGRVELPSLATDTEEFLRRRLAASAATLTRLAAAFDELAAASTHPWLERGQTPSFMGRTSATLWLEGTQRAAEVARLAAGLADHLLADGAEFHLVAQWIDDAPLANQDVGFMGVKQLAERAEAAVTAAVQRLETPHTALAHAYDGLQTHPFHLAVGSYLSAAGLSAAALLSLVTVATRLGRFDLIPLWALLEP